MQAAPGSGPSSCPEEGNLPSAPAAACVSATGGRWVPPDLPPDDCNIDIELYEDINTYVQSLSLRKQRVSDEALEQAGFESWQHYEWSLMVMNGCA